MESVPLVCSRFFISCKRFYSLLFISGLGPVMHTQSFCATTKRRARNIIIVSQPVIYRNSLKYSILIIYSSRKSVGWKKQRRWKIKRYTCRVHCERSVASLIIGHRVSTILNKMHLIINQKTTNACYASIT